MRRQIILSISIATWLGLVVFGLFQLEKYANTPGKQATAIMRWPGATTISRSIEKPTLIMFLHPMCPCSRASLEELEVVMSRTQNRAAVVIAFVREVPEATMKNASLWQEATRISGAKVVQVDRKEAASFGATTSGHTLLYDTSGNVIYQGGITEARGHSGDNFGVDSIVSALSGLKSKTSHLPTFGCSFDEDG